MQTLPTSKDVRWCVQQWQRIGETVAFVPTMGNLHAGHLSLVNKASKIADHVVVSIFVNPLQFNDAADYSNYPRTLDDDIKKLTASSVDMVFTPSETELYPKGREHTTLVIEPLLGSLLEGEHRPGHFTGVTTVVNKFFNIVQPDFAVFGEKDYQQLHIVRKMVADLNMPIEIIGVATSREQDGLAMSSRNSRLDEQQRQIAVGIYTVMNDLRMQLLAGANNISHLEKTAGQKLDALGFENEYVVIRSAATLLEEPDGANLIILVAARLGNTRLIDNLRV
jgi:pantoate--beta-alanine ligase